MSHWLEHRHEAVNILCFGDECNLSSRRGGAGRLAAAAKTRHAQFSDVSLTIHFVSTDYSYRKTPPETVIEYDDRLFLKGELLRHECRLPIAHGSGPKRRFFTKLQIGVMNEAGTTSLFPEGIGTDSTPSGITRPGRDLDTLASLGVLPVVVYFRGDDYPLTKRFFESLEPGATGVLIDGVLCDEFHYRHDIYSKKYWFDSQSGTVKKYESRRNDRLISQLDIQYEVRKPYGLIPKTWTYKHFDSQDRVEWNTVASITDFTDPAGNNPSQFQITFPVGALVSDENKRQEYRIAADGSHERIIQPAQAKAMRVPWMLVWAGAAALLFVLTLLMTVLRFRRRRLAGCQ